MKLQQIFEAQDAGLLAPYRKNLREMFHEKVFMYRGVRDLPQDKVKFGDTSVYFMNTRKRESKSGFNTLMYLSKQWKNVPPRDESVYASFDEAHALQFGEFVLVVPADSVNQYAAIPTDFNMSDSRTVKNLVYAIHNMLGGPAGLAIKFFNMLLANSDSKMMQDHPDWLEDSKQIVNLLTSPQWEDVAQHRKVWTDAEDEQDEMFAVVLKFYHLYVNAKVVKKYGLDTEIDWAPKSKFSKWILAMTDAAMEPGNPKGLYAKMLTFGRNASIFGSATPDITDALGQMGIPNADWDTVKSKFTPETLNVHRATSISGLSGVAHKKYKEVWFTGPYLLIYLGDDDAADVLLNDILPLV